MYVLGAGGGFQRAKCCGILSGDHPSYENRRLAEVLLYLRSGGDYKSPKVRTSVNRLSCCLNSGCVFCFVFRVSFPRQQFIASSFFTVVVLIALLFFWFLIENCWCSVDSQTVSYMEQKCELFSHQSTQPLLCLYAWENVQKSRMNTCPEDVQFQYPLRHSFKSLLLHVTLLVGDTFSRFKTETQINIVSLE